MAATGIDFRIGGNRAYYAPGPDYVMVPPPQAFFEPINWYRTGLHEMGHASGHHSRLNRDLTGAFGTQTSALEETVAAMNTASRCASSGIASPVHHAHSTASWLEVLREPHPAPHTGRP